MENHETELSLVISLMQDNSRIMDVDLIPDEFAFEEPRSIYVAIQDLTAMNMPADVVTVAEYMEAKSDNAHWFQRIGTYVSNATCANAKAYASSIRSNATKRRAAEIAQTLAETAGEGQQSVDVAIKALMEIGRTTRQCEFTIKETLRAAIEDIQDSMETGDMPGVPSGIESLDRITGGFHDTDLIIIGARPAMGKTAFMLNCAIGSNEAVGIISSEQGYSQVGGRMLAMEGMVPIAKMRNAQTLDDSDFARITGASSRMMKRDIYINDMPSPTLGDIARQARQWKFRNNVKAIYIDYIQRIKTEGNRPRHEQVGDIALGLKELARELNIPIIVLAQVSRGVETRPCKRPTMADLKDSGGIEQEADMVMTLYRDEVYNSDTADKGSMEILMCKNRHGPTGFCRVAWMGEYLKVGDLDNRAYQS